MKILVIGCRGQLGSQIMSILERGTSELGEIPEQYKSTEVIGTDSEELDIVDLERTKEYIKKVKPDIVINSAAYTNVDQCEKNMDLAFKVNSLGARNLAIACEEVGAK